MLKTLAFGDVESGVWGAMWELGADARFALLGASLHGEARAVDARIDGSGAEDSWWIGGPGIELEVSPAGAPALFEEGFDQLVHVRGSWVSEEIERPVDCLGRRGARAGIEAGGFETVRDVSAWFEPDLGFAVVSARPRGAAGHAGDAVSASVLEEGHALPVVEPRLSTTYTASGLPARASLELWLVEPTYEPDEGENDDEERVERFPRRAAGETLDARGRAADGILSAQAELLRWHARGRDGLGVYVLAQLAQA